MCWCSVVDFLYMELRDPSSFHLVVLKISDILIQPLQGEKESEEKPKFFLKSSQKNKQKKNKPLLMSSLDNERSSWGRREAD